MKVVICVWTSNEWVENKMPAQQSNGITSQTFSGELEPLGVNNVPLQCLYTDVCSMGTNQNQKSVCSFRAMTLLGEWRYGGMAHRTGVLQLFRKGDIGRQWGRVPLLVMESSRNAWSSALGWLRSHKRDNGGRLVGRPIQSALLVGICYRPTIRKQK